MLIIINKKKHIDILKRQFFCKSDKNTLCLVINSPPKTKTSLFCLCSYFVLTLKSGEYEL